MLTIWWIKAAKNLGRSKVVSSAGVEAQEKINKIKN